MCTAATYLTNEFYFGRTLDYDFTYGESVTVTPRNFPFHMRHCGTLSAHYAIIGIAHVKDGYPLYYDAVNENGLCIAGLNFFGNAVFRKETDGKNNVAQFELVPYLLGQCASVGEVRTYLENINITDTPFSSSLPPSPLHWIIADKHDCIVLESVHDGVHVYNNPVGVLTNNPPFPMQMFALNNYMQLSAKPPQNRFSPELPLTEYSRGMGALGLPGDLSSQSRFIRAAFVRMNSFSEPNNTDSMNQFFHILRAVEQPRGCCVLENGKFETTVYTSCCNADRGIYCYTTYDNMQPTAVDMHRENLDGDSLISYPLRRSASIFMENA